MKLEKVLMKTMFQKSLVALALATAGFAANAAVLERDATPAYVDYSKQGLQTTGADETVTAQFTVTLKAEYKNDDVVEVKFTSPVSEDWTPTDLIAGNVVGKAVVTLGWLETSEDRMTVRYRVTDVNKTAGNSTKDTTLTFEDVVFDTVTLLSVKEIKATYAAKTATGGFALDSAKTNTAVILAAVDQFALEVEQAIEGEITLASKRTAVTDEEDLDLTLTDDAADLRAAVTIPADGITYTVEGDFSWIKDELTTAGLQSDAILVPADCAYKDLSSTKAKLVFTCDTVFEGDFLDIAANTANATAGVTPSDAGKTKTLNATKYTLGAVAKWTGGEYTLLTREAIGAWTVEGATVDVPYLVYGVVGDKDYNIITSVTNLSGAAGKVTVDLFKEDGSVIKEAVDAGTVAAQGQLSVASAIKTALGSYTGKFSARIFVEVPEGKAEVYSAYQDKENNERAIVINTSNEDGVQVP
jgi:hypothetical protein